MIIIAIYIIDLQQTVIDNFLPAKRVDITMKMLILLSCVLFLSASAIEEDGDCNTLAINSSLTQPINGELHGLTTRAG